MTRAVTVDAPTPLVYRWLCQLSVAPYSYDLLDNRGRRSPRVLTPGADQLRAGQRLQDMFEVADVRPGFALTVRGLPRATHVFGEVSMTYAVEPGTDTTTRLIGRLVTSTPTRPARLRAAVLAWGDLVMMRKQLLNLKRLAERDAQA